MKKCNILLALALCAVLFGCGTDTTPISQSERAIYHWKTTFNPTQWEQQFLTDHAIDRIYLHLFDVVPNDEDNDVIPVATLRFIQQPPSDIEIVPTVYVSREAMDLIDNTFRIFEYDVARHIYDRIAAMMRCQGIGFREIQLDCDGSASTSYTTNNLFEHLVRFAHEDSVQVSATIRLSQLANVDRLPWCDRYMLMLYNTGALQNKSTRNSILDYNDVQPYMKYFTRQWLDTLAARGKQLDCAYPLYGWGVAFHPNGQFSHLVPSSQLPAQGNDTLRIEWGEPSTIAQVQEAVNAKMPSRHHRTTVLYHLDSASLAHYSFDEIETILWR